MRACTNPTKSSSAINGSGRMYGTRNPTTISSTLPANIFPKSRKENESVLEISPIASKIPRTALSGEVKFMNLEIYYLKPIKRIANVWVMPTEIRASATVT